MPTPALSTPLTAKLRHLHAAAHFLAPKCPAVSSHLGTQFQRVALEEAPSTTNLHAEHRHEICGACGTILDPGRSCQVRIERVDSAGRVIQDSDRKQRKERRRAAKSDDDGTGSGSKVIVYQCGRCNAETHQALPPPPTANRAAIARRLGALKEGRDNVGNADVFSASTTPTEPSSKPAAVANSTSKKRAKARKQTGLQAMLVKSKEDARAAAAERNSSASGFNLMDFMTSA